MSTELNAAVTLLLKNLTTHLPELQRWKEEQKRQSWTDYKYTVAVFRIGFSPELWIWFTYEQIQMLTLNLA